MDNITNSLARTPGDVGAQTLAKAFGINPEQAQKMLQTVLPEMTGELERLTLSRGNLAALIAAFGRASHEDFVNDPQLLRDDAAQREGETLLGQIFGTKHKSRVVAKRAASSSGLSQEAIKQMLPSIAGMFMGELERQTREPLRNAAKASSFGGQGNDPFANQSPLPVPGRNMGGSAGSSRRRSYDDFADEIRRKGGRVSRNGSLANIIRDLIGSAAGFKNTGVIGWIIRFIVARYGWRILSSIMGRFFGR